MAGRLPTCVVRIRSPLRRIARDGIGYDHGVRLAAVVLAALVLPASAAAAPVAAPRFVRNIATGETGWFSSPGLVDLNGDGKLEIVAPFYSTFVFDAQGRLLGKGTATKGRVYAPERRRRPRRRRRPEIVVGGNEGTVAAYDLAAARCSVKPGWPASTCSGGQCPETRGLAAADLDGDGRVEVVATTTNTVVDRLAGVRLRREAGYGQGRAGRRGRGTTGRRATTPTSTASATTATARTARTSAIGNLDDDPQLEIVVTFDNHQINVFNHDGTSVLASPWFTNRESALRRPAARLGPVHPLARPGGRGAPLPPAHRRLARRPARRSWLQWTASPPAVADLDGDGRNEVIGLPNAERKEPYETQAYAFMVLDGAQGDGARSARRHRGLRDAAADRQAGRARRTATGIRRAASRRRRSSTSPATARPEIVAARARRARLRGRPDRQAALALRLRPRRAEDVRVGGRRRRPQPRRHARARLRHLRARAAAPAGSSCCRRRASCSTTCACRTRAATGTASASRRRRRSRDLDGDGRLEIVLTTLRPRHRRVPRPGLGGQLPAVADRSRRPAALGLGQRLTSRATFAPSARTAASSISGA